MDATWWHPVTGGLLKISGDNLDAEIYSKSHGKSICRNGHFHTRRKLVAAARCLAATCIRGGMGSVADESWTSNAVRRR
jgi:hypothetical protein